MHDVQRRACLPGRVDGFTDRGDAKGARVDEGGHLALRRDAKHRLDLGRIGRRCVIDAESDAQSAFIEAVPDRCFHELQFSRAGDLVGTGR